MFGRTWLLTHCLVVSLLSWSTSHHSFISHISVFSALCWSRGNTGNQSDGSEMG